MRTASSFEKLLQNKYISLNSKSLQPSVFLGWIPAFTGMRTSEFNAMGHAPEGTLEPCKKRGLPLPLTGEGAGEGGMRGFPLTSILPRRGEEACGVIF